MVVSSTGFWFCIQANCRSRDVWSHASRYQKAAEARQYVAISGSQQKNSEKPLHEIRKAKSKLPWRQQCVGDIRNTRYPSTKAADVGNSEPETEVMCYRSQNWRDAHVHWCPCNAIKGHRCQTCNML